MRWEVDTARPALGRGWINLSPRLLVHQNRKVIDSSICRQIAEDTFVIRDKESSAKLIIKEANHGRDITAGTYIRLVNPVSSYNTILNKELCT